MRIKDLLSEQQLDELSFMGSQCTKDCSGHRAGYKWSLDRGGVENPASPSQSFINGSNIGHRQIHNNKQKRTQGGGKIAGYQSQTANAQRKRDQRAQARVDQGVQGSPMDEGWQDFGKKEPYWVCIGGKKWKHFDYYEDARRAHDNLKKKWYREGNPKYDTVTLLPDMDEAMRLKEFAPDHGGNGGGAGQPMSWSHVVKEAISWFHAHGFNAKHAPGADAIQFSKEQEENEYEQVWLMGIMENRGGHIGFMFGSITNGEMDPPLDDYKGNAPMTARGLNHVLLLAEEAFGL